MPVPTDRAATLSMHCCRYRDELLGLLRAWQEGEESISGPLNRIEELIDEEVLEPDVLIIQGAYEHYRYD